VWSECDHKQDLLDKGDLVLGMDHEETVPQ